MKFNNLIGSVAALVISVFAGGQALAAATVNLAQSPLYTTTTSAVKPNLMFILDNSGSMSETYLPDDVPTDTDWYGYPIEYGYWSSQCNGVAYNPNITYTVPVDYSGANFYTPTFTSACSNAFLSSTCTTNLSTNIRNYYYKYTGSQPAMSYSYTSSGVNTGTTFFQECNSTIGSDPGSSVFTKVTVSSTSGPNGTDERNNYAIWYSYYRTRMLMMKTAVSQAFKSINSNFRVGFSTISYTGADSTDPGFLAIDDFNSGSGNQKSKFYSKLFNATGNNNTPLLGALSKAGRIYAGKLGADPMQYSCQQNFTLLSTDGYWNAQSAGYGPYGLDNSTLVGQQDGTALAPLWDGTISVKTETTPSVTTTKVTTPQTVVDRSTHTVTTTQTNTQTRTNTYTRTRITTSTSGCSSGSKVRTRIYTGTSLETLKTITVSKQLQEQLTTTTKTAVATTTSTTTHTVVTTNGKVTTDTVSNPVVVGPTTVTTTNSGPTTGSWTNVGSPSITSVTGPTSTYSPSVTTSNMSTLVSDVTSACTTSVPAASDSITNTVLGTLSDTASSSSSSTSSTTHDAGYPVTTNGASTTVVTGPIVGSTTTSTAGSYSGPQNTLADVAMYYYQTDLRYPNNCTSGSSTGANLCPTDSSGNYSPNVPGADPDNNPKPHMTTFTLGLGMNGLINYSPTYQTDISGDFYAIKQGTKVWPDPISNGGVERVDDLWHAAVNGRGTYFSAKDPSALVKSLSSALAGMSTRLGYGTAAATSNLAPIEGDNALYVASYTTAQWTGNLVAESINPSTGAINYQPAWCLEDQAADSSKNISACTGTLTSLISNASDTRKIYFNNNSSLTSFLAGNLPATQLSWFDPSKLSQWGTTFSTTDKAAATKTTLVEYLRGQTQYEMVAGNAALLYRARKAKFGDVVDSQPVYIGKPASGYADPGYTAWKTAKASRAKTVYVGANDGMLHAINATNGTERWAFVPTPVMPNMYWLADSTYTTNHHQYADGPVSYSDVCVKDCTDSEKADWRTILIGGLGAGGRGYYAFDVTDSTNPVFLWEFTSLNDADLGYTYGNPVIAKTKTGAWKVLFTSGYDNVKLSNGNPYDADGSGGGFLFVVDPLAGPASYTKIPTGSGSKSAPSGLAKISAWADDATTDATALYVYGGDLDGNFWRFDINADTSQGQAKVIKLAKMVDSTGNAQPITTKPELASVNSTRMIYVVTGKYLEASDLDSSGFKTQTIYGFIDSGTDPSAKYVSSTGASTLRSALVKQTMANAKPYRTITSASVVIPSQNGWYVDLPDSGERGNVDPMLASGTLVVATNVPTNGICEAGGYSWINYFDYRTGSYVTGSTSAGTWGGNDLTTGINAAWIGGKPEIIRTGSGTAPSNVSGVPFGSGSAGVVGHRVSWRELYPQ